MNTEAATIEPSPSISTDAPRGPQMSFADAVRANDHFQKTGERIDLKKDATKDATPPPAKKEAAPLKPTDKAPTTKPNGAEAPSKGIASIKAKTAQTDDKSKVDPTKGAADDDKSQSRWSALKDLEKQHLEIKPKYEAYEKENAELKARLAELEPVSQKYKDIIAERDREDITQSDRYQKEVEAPFNKISQKAWDIAEAAVIKEGMDERGLQMAARKVHENLMEALNEKNSILRERKLKAVLEECDNETPTGNLANLVEKGDELHSIFGLIEEMQKNADLEKAQHANAKKAEKLKTDTEAQQIQAKANEEVIQTLKTNASDVLDEKLLQQAQELAKSNESGPMDIAFRSMAEHLVAPLIEMVRNITAERDTLKKEMKDMEEAKPGIKPSKDSPTDKNLTAHGSLTAAVQSHKEAGGHF